jgi:quinol monooxygenase YgiN
MSYALINKMTTQPGKRDAVIEIMLKSGAAFNDNSSCVLYVVSKDKKDDDVLWVQDVWTNEDDHKAAMNDADMQAYVKQAMPLLDGMPQQIEVEMVGGKMTAIAI